MFSFQIYSHTHTHVSTYTQYIQSSYLSTLYGSSISLAAAAKPRPSCPTLCDPIDGSPPGSPVPGILQARTLEWVAIAFSSAWKWKVKVKSLSRVWLFATLWTTAYQAPPSMGFSRQEDWSGMKGNNGLFKNESTVSLCLQITHYFPSCHIQT